MASNGIVEIIGVVTNGEDFEDNAVGDTRERRIRVFTGLDGSPRDTLRIAMWLPLLYARWLEALSPFKHKMLLKNFWDISCNIWDDTKGGYRLVQTWDEVIEVARNDGRNFGCGIGDFAARFCAALPDHYTPIACADLKSRWAIMCPMRPSRFMRTTSQMC